MGWENIRQQRAGSRGLAVHQTAEGRQYILEQRMEVHEAQRAGSTTGSRGP